MIKKSDIFPIGIGTWGIGGFTHKDASINKNKQTEAVAHMFKQGLNYIELNLWNAQGYAAEIVAEALELSGKNREDIFIVQAVYLYDGKLRDVEMEVERLLKLFKTDYIDSLQLTQSVFLDYEFEDICTLVERLVSQGIARFTSITNEDLYLLRKYHERFGEKLFSHEVCYNFEIRENEKEGLLEYAQQHNIITAVYQPLRRNRTANRNWPLLVNLAAKYRVTQNQIILSWLLAKGLLPLTKSDNINHINEHLIAVNLKLEELDIDKLNTFTAPSYQAPAIDWNKTGDGIRVDQLSNVFDDEYNRQLETFKKI